MEKDKQVEAILLMLRNRGLERDFKQLYDLLYDRFFRIAIYYLKKEEWAQEVVLDVFLTLWKKKEELSEISNFENYYFILLKNASLNYLEKNKKQYTEQLDDTVNLQQASTNPETILLNDELLLIYVQALDDLPTKCREVFLLVREQGMSYKEVAEQLNISTKTVDAQLQKAVTRLKEKIKVYFL